MGLCCRWWPLYEGSGKIIMIDLLLNKLKEHKEIFAYEIYNVQKDGRELFYVLNKLELNRAVKTKNISCNIYVRDGDKQGSSLINIVAFDDEKSIEEKIDKAILKAKTVMNAFFPLSNNQENIENIKEDNLDLNEIALKVANAVFKADVYEGGYLNSTEIFITKTNNEFINSSGIHHKTNNLKIMIEAIPSWTGEKEEVELYEMYKSTVLDEEAITKRMNEVLLSSLNRSKAKTLKEVDLDLKVPVYVEGEMLELLVNNFKSETSYKSQFYNLSHYKKGDSISNTPFDIIAYGGIKGLTDSLNYDEHGVVLSNKKIIEDGKVIDYYGDIQFGHYLKIENPSGTLPVCELIAKDKMLSQEKIKKEKHLLVPYFSSPQLDESSGYFGGEVRLALYYDGEKYLPLTSLSISGNIYEAIKDVEFSEEIVSLNSYKGPKYMILKDLDIH